MKSRIHLKLLMAPLSMLTLLACSPDQYQQASEYDDVYFTSADRKTAPRVVAKSEAVQEAEAANVITLSNQSRASVDPTLLSRYNNSESKEVEYFVKSEAEPKVARADDLNYDNFVLDYENEMLSTYALPVDWAEEWDRRYFNDLVNNDFEFRLAWYDQYYTGDNTRMDRYITASNGRIGRTSMSTFGGNRFGNNFGNGFFNPGFNVSIGIGRGFGFNNPFFGGGGFGFNDPFFGGGGFGYDPFFDPFFYSSSIWGRRNSFNRWNTGWGFGNRSGFGFRNNFYCPPIFSNQYIYRGDILVSRDDRTFTRGGRLSSTSVASVRSDATNGVAQTRSQRLASSAGTSRLTRSSVDNRASRTGRVSSSSQAVGTRSSRVRTDAYRFNDSRTSSRSSSRTGTTPTRSSSNAITSRSSRTSRSTPTISSGRTSSRSTTGRTSGVSFNRNTSSRSSSSTGSSSRSSGVSRSSSSRSSGSVSRGSSSRSSGSVSRGSGSSSRSSGSVSRSSSSSSRSSSSSSKSSSSSSRSSSSKSGRGN